MSWQCMPVMRNLLLSILPWLYFRSHQGFSVEQSTMLGVKKPQKQQRVFNQALKKLPSQSPPPGEKPASPSLKKVIGHSQESRDDIYLAVDQLIIGLLEDSQIGDLLKEAGVATARVKSELKRLARKERKKVGSALDDIFFPALKTYGRDLAEHAGKFDPVIGRDEEIKKVVGILSKRTKNNAVLIGQPSLDNTAIVQGVAERIARGDVPSNLGGVRLIALDMHDLIVGVKYGRIFKERLEVVLKDVARARGKVIVFIDEIHLVLDAWQPPWTVAANLLKPMLAKGQLRCIGAMTFEKYRKCVDCRERRVANPFSRFRQVHVAEPSVPNTISRGLKDRHERHLGVRIRDWGLVAAHLCNEYITGVDSQPGGIDNLMRWRMQLEEATQAHLVEIVREELDNLREKREPLMRKYKKENKRITEVKSMLTETLGPEHVHEVLSNWTGKLVSRLGQNEKERLVGLAERLHQKVVGQDQVGSAVAEAVLRSRAGFGRPQQTTNSFLFLGPTGVGKTELAKALTEQLFDDKNLLIRINMLEYVEQHSVSKLIGAPPE
ncbi:hypothetical protein NL676_003528 [Syzygium grande]|nr:hypothetical protein NL676_003528 [Syzygium grande]